MWQKLMEGLDKPVSQGFFLFIFILISFAWFIYCLSLPSDEEREKERKRKGEEEKEKEKKFYELVSDAIKSHKKIYHDYESLDKRFQRFEEELHRQYHQERRKEEEIRKGETAKEEESREKKFAELVDEKIATHKEV